MNRSLLFWIGKIANDNPHGDGFGVPTDWQSMSCALDENTAYTALIENDAFEVLIGRVDDDRHGSRHSENVCILRREFVLRLSIWYMRQWILGEWFGLRRKLFYWWLHRNLERWESSREERR